MGDQAIALCGSNGCVFAIKKQNQICDDSNSLDEDKLLLKVIKSNLKTPICQCEIKCPTDNMNTVLIVYGNSDERKKIFDMIKDEMRSYLLAFYNVVPLNILAARVGDKIKKINFQKFANIISPEVILASWTNNNGYELYSVNVNGESFKRFGCAIGCAKEAVKEDLSKLDVKSMDVRQLLTNVTKIAIQYCDEEDDVQISWICDATNGKHQVYDNKLAKEIMEQ